MNRDDLQKKLDGLRQVADQHGTVTGDTTEQQYEDLGDAIAQVEQLLKHAAHHTLKIKPEPFADLLSGAKTCEVRANHDRDFRAGDTVTLLELAPLGKPGYSGRQMTRTISHVQEGYGLPVGLCVLSYAPEDAPGFTDWMRDHGREALRHELGVEELMEGAFHAGAKRVSRSKASRAIVQHVSEDGAVSLRYAEQP